LVFVERGAEQASMSTTGRCTRGRAASRRTRPPPGGSVTVTADGPRGILEEPAARRADILMSSDVVAGGITCYRPTCRARQHRPRPDNDL